MKSTRDAVEHSRHSDGTPVAPEPSRVPENDEWIWMVDEDPAFYLTKSGRKPENTGG